MEKERLFEVLMQAEPEDLTETASRLRRGVPHEVVKPPSRELVMFRAEESVEKIDFNVGEILVTTAEVRVKDTLGFAMVMDADEAKALDAALLMGVLESGLPQGDTVKALAVRLEKKMTARLREEREIAGATRVEFEVMGGQDPNVDHNAK